MMLSFGVTGGALGAPETESMLGRPGFPRPHAEGGFLSGSSGGSEWWKHPGRDSAAALALGEAENVTFCHCPPVECSLRGSQ